MNIATPTQDSVEDSLPRSGHRAYNYGTGTHTNWPLSPVTPVRCAGGSSTRSFSSGGPAYQSTAAPVPRAPTPPSSTTEAASEDLPSTDDLYGPDRLFGPPLVSLPGPGPAATTAFGSIFAHGLMPAPFMDAPHDSADLPAANPALANPGQYFKDAIARDASNVTPGVDDTPYILYALDALTGNITTSAARASEAHGSHTTSDHNSFPYRYVPDDGLGYYQPRTLSGATANIGTASIKLPESPSPVLLDLDRRFSARLAGAYDPRAASPPLSPTRTAPHVSVPPAPPAPPVPPAPVDARASGESTGSSLSTLVYPDALQPPRTSLPADHLKDAWIYLDLKRFSPQTQLVFPEPNFKPVILRPVALGLLFLLCLLMTSGLIFCAVYSSRHAGLVRYGDSIYGGQFFMFRVLPSLLSATLLLYAQAVASAVVRIHPFSRMQALTSPHPEERSGAIFDGLYPRFFLWPPVTRAMPWRVWAPLLVIWLTNWAVPVQSALFSVVLVDGTWRWATVQGVAWTLVAIYACLAAAVGLVLAYWYDRPTGLIWDPRSIADLVALATNSNAMADYRGSELLATRDDLRRALRHRAVDKLGYWTWRDGRAMTVWHGIGTDQLDDAWVDVQGPGPKADRSWNEKLRPFRGSAGSSVDGVDLEAQGLSPHSERVRYRYLPWCLRDGVLFSATTVALALLVALFVVSFLPATHISAGFLPLVNPRPTDGAFSAANFLYSFLPALLGQVLYLLFASLDLELRVVQPWAELAKNAGGAQPESSILADYAACLPLQSAWHAARNRHWRVAAVSLLSTCLAFLPALSGGLFLALTVSDGVVRMLPNMALYGVVLALLVLSFACLVAVLPHRHSFRLPHGVTCMAEIFSFCANDDLLQEPAFKNAHNRATLLNQLGLHSRPTDRSRWIFSTGTSGDDRRLGIRRVRRYTELTNRPSGRRPPAAGNR